MHTNNILIGTSLAKFKITELRVIWIFDFASLVIGKGFNVEFMVFIIRISISLGLTLFNIKHASGFLSIGFLPCLPSVFTFLRTIGGNSFLVSESPGRWSEMVSGILLRFVAFFIKNILVASYRVYPNLEHEQCRLTHIELLLNQGLHYFIKNGILM